MNLSSTTLRAPDILTRSERKDLTRNTLIQSALNLIGQGRSFTSLGIREIAREAGIVPNAFYRHFSTTDELGLALVEEVGITLRRLLREARQAGVAKNEVVRHSVKVYHEYLKQNRLQFLFISSERAGGSRVLRQAIRNDVIHFRNMTYFIDSDYTLNYRRKAAATRTLWESDQPRDIAELQWRISRPLATILLALIAVTFIRSTPRQDKTDRTYLIAALVFAAYYNFTGLAKSWVEQGVVGSIPGIWWLYLLMLVALGIYALLSSRQRQFSHPR